MSRSFRFHLAVRFTAAMTVTAATIGAASLLGLRAMLDRELNGTILNVATIQAASVTDSPEMHFHEWELTPGEAGSVRELIRYVQVWDMSGRSLLRSQFMTGDLPVDRDAVSQAAAGGFIWREQSFDGIPVARSTIPSPVSALPTNVTCSRSRRLCWPDTRWSSGSRYSSPASRSWSPQHRSQGAGGWRAERSGRYTR